MTTSPARTPGRPPAPSAETGPTSCCDNLVRIFSSEGVEVVALQGLDLEVGSGRARGARRGLRAPASPRCSRSCRDSTCPVPASRGSPGATC